MADLTCTYAGLLGVDIRTYTTTYAPQVLSWDFNTQSMQPMESHVWLKGGVVSGISGRVIDLATGYTDYLFGSSAGASENAFTSEPFWSNGRIRGFTTARIASLALLTYDYPLTLGNSINSSSFKTLQPVTLPNQSNTEVFSAYTNGNNQGRDDTAYCGGIINLSDVYYSFDRNGGVTRSVPGFTLGLNINFSIRACMPYNGRNYCIMALNNNVKGIRLLETNFFDEVTEWVTNFQNPPNSTFNADVELNRDGTPFQSTYQGWLALFKGTYTIEGIVCNGLAVLVAPDFSRYWLIRLNPVDALAATWTTTIGNANAKFDLSNAMWIKNTTVQNVLFITSGTVLRQLPIYPPVVLPAPPPDTETTIIPYRESGAKT